MLGQGGQAGGQAGRKAGRHVLVRAGRKEGRYRVGWKEGQSVGVERRRRKGRKQGRKECMQDRGRAGRKAGMDQGSFRKLGRQAKREEVRVSLVRKAGCQEGRRVQ